MSKLYVVATPIGNLGDLSPRALEVLRACALIAAEDTRVTRKLSARFSIDTRMVSNHQHNEAVRAAELVERMLGEDFDVALVTDAGTPGVSDPGSLLVRAAAEAGVEVVAVPGPTAMAAALSISGFDTREFAFYGFPPRAAGPLREKLLAIARSGVPVAVLHESPHRVPALLEAIAEVLSGAALCLCCDLTKRYEIALRGDAPALLARVRANPNAGKGEYCLVMDLHGVQPPPLVPPAPPISLEARLLERALRGERLRDAEAALRAEGEKRNEVYAAALRLKELFENGLPR